MNKRILFFMAMLCVASLSSSAAAELLKDNLSYRRFTTLDGLSQMQTETVWQDSRGYIYRYAVGIRALRRAEADTLP